MINTLRSEIRKLLTVRSTYWITAILIALIALIHGYGQGYRSSGNISPTYLYDSLLVVANFTALFAAIVGVLLMAHEYRYNTIVYTVVNSNSRTKLLLSKILAIIIYCFFLTLIIDLAALGGIALGANLAGNPLPHQEINYLLYFAKSFFYVTGYGLVGLLVAALIRNLVASIAFLFIVPNAIETLANLFLKEKSVYMPFSALDQVVMTVPPDVSMGPFVLGRMDPVKAALVFLAWLVAGWLITWYLFLRRDAT